MKAIESGRSSYLGVEPVSNRVRYYLTEAIRETSLLGVAVVRIEFDDLEATWERGGERIKQPRRQARRLSKARTPA